MSKNSAKFPNPKPPLIFLGIIFLLLIGTVVLSQQKVTIFSQAKSNDLQTTSMNVEKEPNDDLTTATPLTIGIDTDGTLNTGKDVDIYSVAITKPAKVKLTFSRLPQRYDLYIYDPHQNLIATTTRTGFSESEGTFLARETGVYHFKFFTNYNNPNISPYTIRLSLLSLFEK